MLGGTKAASWSRGSGFGPVWAAQADRIALRAQAMAARMRGRAPACREREVTACLMRRFECVRKPRIIRPIMRYFPNVAKVRPLS
ncbi:hypothetical protein AA103193_1026 [Tanticharoenia sakaeratensis NBRC 103193]|nr:hypothetical protein AA103193_1026 [Tanticharoenia sakaeratensis NBRC 103193]